MIGDSLGDYILQQEIGSGGMGKVFIAQHAVLGRRVAIKVLTPDVYEDDTMWRFFNEARAAVQIGHPAIIDIQHFGIDPAGRGYIVMELLAGESLSSRLRRVRTLDVHDALRIAIRLAGALDAAHRAGVIHRDLKPANVFLALDPESGRERVKLLDFGVAKLVEQLAGPVRTRRNMVLGTPAYMPPEQWRTPTAIDHRVDLYALGCLLFEMLTGTPPFETDSHIDALQAHLFRTPPHLARLVPGLPRGLPELVNRLLAKRADDRPASAGDVLRELESLEMLVRPRRRWPLVATTAGVLAAAGLVVALLASGDASQIADHAPLISVPAPPAPISAPQPPPTAVAPPAPVASLVPTRELPSPARRRARRFAALPQPAAPPAPDRRALTDEAQRAFLRGDPVTALELCRQALEIDQAALQPLLVCALASCRLQSAERARGFLTRVPAERRRLIEPNCRALGIAAPVPSSMPRAD